MLRVQTLIAASVASIIALMAIAAPAQAQNTESWWRVDIVQVKPERLSDFIELYREEINPALRKAGVPWRSTWQTGEFGETYERLFVTPMASFAELDAGGPLARALSPRDLDRVLEKLRRSIDRRQSYAVLYRADLSVESDDVSGLPIARVTNLEVAPGRGAEFEAFLRDNLETFQAAGVVFGVYQRQFGPGPVVWQIVENLRSYSELARGGILRAFGEDSGLAASRLSGVLLGVERTVLEYDPTLSFTAVTEPGGQN
jgi:hypothetical protein